MMKAEKILSLYAMHTERWIKEIERSTDDTFHHKVSGWTFSQVVDHVCKTTHKCLDLAALCCAGQGERGRSGFGPAIFSMMGSFPPVKIKVKTPPPGTENIYHPNAISRENAITALNEALVRMTAMLEEIRRADPGIRARHWAGGWFNAKQWYHNAEMHIKHHFRQLERIRKIQEK